MQPPLGTRDPAKDYGSLAKGALSGAKHEHGEAEDIRVGGAGSERAPTSATSQAT